MPDDPVSVTSLWSKDLVGELSEDEFRRAYMMDQVRTFIAYQIRALREQSCRKWSQTELANRSGKTQSVISRLEDPDYGQFSLQTLFEIANAFDLPLMVQFPDWEEWLEKMSNVSPVALQKRSFNRDRLMALADRKRHVSAVDSLKTPAPTARHSASTAHTEISRSPQRCSFLELRGGALPTLPEPDKGHALATFAKTLEGAQ